MSVPPEPLALLQGGDDTVSEFSDSGSEDDGGWQHRRGTASDSEEETKAAPAAPRESQVRGPNPCSEP